MEIELKFKTKEFDNIKSRLKKLGAKNISEKHQEDVYFRHILDTEKRWVLRIRNGEILTVKTGEEGCWEEEEIYVAGDIEKIIAFCETLGFKKELEIHKEREVWNLDSFSICFDKIRKLGSFVEIEGPSWKQIELLAKKLGILQKPIKDGYVKMMQSKLKI